MNISFAQKPLLVVTNAIYKNFTSILFGLEFALVFKIKQITLFNGEKDEYW